MENPQDGELIEEDCSSSESGWTMYLSSPVHHEDDDCCHDIDVDDCGEEAEDGFVDNTGFDSDDSMVSDASSGPAHHGSTDHGGYMGGRGEARAHPIKKVDKKGEDALYDDHVDEHVEEGGDQESSSISPSIQESLQ